jgi:hypothetical protein
MTTATMPTEQEPRVARTGRRARRWLLAVGGLALLVAALFVGGMALRMSQPAPADLDLSTTRLSAQGLYRATIRPDRDPIPVNQLHSWTIHIETADGRPVEQATIAVDGDMPQHGHGLPTRPQVTRALGNGDYLVEGMKFQMGGWWFVAFDIDAAAGRDRARFDMILK